MKTLKIYIEINLANSFIRLSKSLVGALIFFDKKLGRNLDYCVDYWGLNNITIKNQYLLLLIGKLLNQLGWAKRWTQLDLTNVYHWMRIGESDEWNTAFQTKYGHFKYQVMFFGLFNAPATFYRYINKILAKKLDVFVIIYLENIIIYTKNLSQPHVKVVCKVLEQLWKYLFFANLKKYCFYQDEICFLGYVMSSKGISIEAKKIEVVRK